MDVPFFCIDWHGKVQCKGWGMPVTLEDNFDSSLKKVPRDRSKKTVFKNHQRKKTSIPSQLQPTGFSSGPHGSPARLPAQILPTYHPSTLHWAQGDGRGGHKQEVPAGSGSCPNTQGTFFKLTMGSYRNLTVHRPCPPWLSFSPGASRLPHRFFSVFQMNKGKTSIL